MSSRRGDAYHKGDIPGVRVARNAKYVLQLVESIWEIYTPNRLLNCLSGWSLRQAYVMVQELLRSNELTFDDL